MSDNKKHALLSPSSAHRWVPCPASILMSEGIPNTTSSYAEEGTRAHALAESMLTNGSVDFAPDHEMVSYVSIYTDFVSSIPGDRLIEHSLNLTPITGEADAQGTADAIIYDTVSDTLWIIDLKYGQGVQVDAVDNLQLMIYGMAALVELDPIYGFQQATKINLAIVQPRVSDAALVWSTTVERLEIEAERVSKAADTIFDAQAAGAELVPCAGEKQCRFCPAKYNPITDTLCPALEAETETVNLPAANPSVFENVTDDESLLEALTLTAQAQPSGVLAAAMAKVALVEMRCKVIRDEAHRRLMEASPVTGFKLVLGRPGNRAWFKKEVVAKVFKDYRVKKDEAYDLELISPAVAEKRFKKEKPKLWEKLNECISRADGKPTVVPATDERPEWLPPVATFEQLEAQEAEEQRKILENLGLETA